MKQYTTLAKVVFIANVTVEAKDIDEAREKFENLEWFDDGMAGSDIIYYKTIGNFTLTDDDGVNEDENT